MLLAIAVENTRTVVGLLDGDTVKRHWRVGTDQRRTADEWAVLITGLLREATVDGMAVCSAVPRVLHELREVAARYFGDVPAVIVEPGVKTGLPVLMDNPREVGTDRIVNAVAVAHHYGDRGPCIVVDVGTATTYDVVSPKGQYIGGVIAPGIEVSLDALRQRAAQLRTVELVRPRTVVARNTVEAMQAGAVFGAAGQIEGVVGRILAEQGWQPGDVTVVATGGLAPLVVPECTVIDEHQPWLTLLGLRLVFDRNV
ncbi:MAG TPA: type III pantothenate kinase [Kribbellaceae bacterium]|nr:type III pantothenate kinase [Kribbellaceae bacterium]